MQSSLLAYLLGQKKLVKKIMNIKILGTRGEIEESAPYHSKKSGVLINNKLLLDCGGQLGNHLTGDHKEDRLHIAAAVMAGISINALWGDQLRRKRRSWRRRISLTGKNYNFTLPPLCFFEKNFIEYRRLFYV